MNNPVARPHGIRFKEIADDQIEALRNYIEKLIAGDISDSLEETIIRTSGNKKEETL